MSRFRLSPGGRRPDEPWFHIGTLEVGTTWLVILLSIVGIVLFAAAGEPTQRFDGTMGGLEGYLGLDPYSLVHGFRIWTLITWPFAYWGVGIFDVIALFLFWWFGSEMERDALGRNRWAWMLGIWTVALGVIMVCVYELTGQDYQLTGMQMLEIMVVLLWIAEWPLRKFFFNIPAWLVGLVLVGIQIIDYLGEREWVLLLDFIVGVVVCGFIARQFGMLSEYPWIPKVVGNRPRRTRLRSVPADPVQARPAPVPSRPWTPPVSQADEDRMNELLEKIHDSGAESLTDRERAELNELRLRRRQGR